MKINFKLTPYQIAEAFPNECLEYIPKVLSVLKSKLLSYQELIQQVKTIPMKAESRDFYLMAIPCLMPNNIKERIETYEKVMKIINNKNSFNNKNVESANRIPIESLYDFQKKRMTSARIQASCPFHGEDRHPSFVIYKSNNTFFCFTCKEGGDAIAFFMKLHKVNFNQAIKELNGTYI